MTMDSNTNAPSASPSSPTYVLNQSGITAAQGAHQVLASERPARAVSRSIAGWSAPQARSTAEMSSGNCW